MVIHFTGSAGISVDRGLTNIKDRLVSKVPLTGNFTMNKGDNVKTIHEWMLVDDTSTDETSGS